jgi:hypothetical protein
VTTPGIGGGAFVGIGLEILPPPVQAAATSSTAGGTLPTASTYKYYVTAINANGETLVSNEQSVTTGAGATNSNTVNWATVVGATGFKIYRTAAGGATGTELLLTAVGLVTTYVDTGALSPAGALPTANTAASPGVYAPPQKYFPVKSETLKQMQAPSWRAPIRHTVDIIGVVQGDVHVEGDLVMECLVDVMPYFMDCSRMAVVKTGSAPWTYTGTPTANAIPNRTMSITVVRNGQVFGYVGCCVHQFKFALNAGILEVTFTMLGTNEAVQSLPSDTYVNDVPFGEGMYQLQFPVATVITDADTFDFTVNDNGVPNYRMRNDTVGASFINFGERVLTMNLTRDFLTRADYDAYKAYGAQAFSFAAAHGASSSITITAPAVIKDTHVTNVSAIGTLVRSVITYKPILDATTSRSYQMVVVTSENMTP